MQEADEIYVLDTGSTDGSYKLLKKLGVHVKKAKIKPWRFDIARNKSLDMVPDDTDLYVCTDIDETFEKGWREKIENNYTPEYSRVKYLYNWSFDENGKPATTFYLDKIHTKDYYWKNPVHEILATNIPEKVLLIEDIVLNHHQLPKTSRSNYLPLLELSVEENPEDDRNMHYLGREYMYYEEYEKAIKTLHKHLSLEKATWKDERCASMRFIARSYNKLGYKEEAVLWYNLAMDEAPYLRESYVEYAYLEYNSQNYSHAMQLLDQAFAIKEKSKSYINENFAWDYQIYDLYAMCAYFSNKKDIAKKYNEIAISLCPNNERLLNNRLFFD